MEDDERIHEGDLDEAQHGLSPLDIHGEVPHDGEGLEDEHKEEEEEEERELEAGGEELKPSIGFSHRAKIIQILKNLHSPEVKIYSESSKEFIGLLRGDLGGSILREFIILSPKCSELAESWRLQKGKPGVAHILSLFSAIFEHQEGKSQIGGIRRSLDNFARLIFAEGIDDIYGELNSQEARRQSAALNLLASIVRRGIGLASEVAKCFDFKLPVLSKLSGIKKKGRKEEMRGVNRSTRNAFVGFAMSFIEVGNLRLLRWILQQRELYSGVLRGIGTDDVDTVVYILSVIRDRVLIEDSLIPPGLRSVLFGSATLEQLSYISGNPTAGAGADIAHEVLLLVCTDPRNGLMPTLNLKGNEKRLLDLMKKLKATKVDYHKKLLLAVVNKRPSLCAAYMDEASAISLAADMICSVNWDAMITSLASNSHNLLAVNDDELQQILKCIIPAACSRLVLNKGLLHSDDLVKHGTLRLVLESVKSLHGVIRAIEKRTAGMSMNIISHTSTEVAARLHFLCGLSCSLEVDGSLEDVIYPQADKIGMEKWISLKQFFQDEVRAVLPDPQVLLKLLSSMSCKEPKNSGKSLKRCSNFPGFVAKKLKSETTNEDIDIMIGGIDAEYTDANGTESDKQDLDLVNDRMVTVKDVWGSKEHNLIINEPLDAEDVFQSKLLEILTFYLRTMPVSFDGAFDFFRVIPVNPLSLPTNRQESLLSLLVEYIGQSTGSLELGRIPESMYKHLQPLINVLLYSGLKNICNKAYILVRAAMISSGAFDQNFAEIDAWLFFLPSYKTQKLGVESQGGDAFCDLSSVVVSFLCDGVSTVGNNLYKHLDNMHRLLAKLDYFEDKLSENEDFEISLCEWRPLKNLLCFARSILNPQSCNLFSESDNTTEGHQSSLFSVLSKVQEFLDQGHANVLAETGTALAFSVLCATPEDVLENFPLLLTVTKRYFNSYLPFLSSIFFLEPEYLAKASIRWPDMFSSAFRMIKGEFLNYCCANNALNSNNSFLKESAAAALSQFLCNASFYALFSSLFSFGCCTTHASRKEEISHSVEILDLLKVKISEGSGNDLLSFLRYTLFWTYQILSTYIAKPSNPLKELLQMCFSIVDYILDSILLLTADSTESKSLGTSPTKHIHDAVDFTFHHPIIDLLLSCPLSYNENSAEERLGGQDDAMKIFSKEYLRPVDWIMLKFLSKLFDFLLNVGNREIYASENYVQLLGSIIKAPMLMIQKILLIFKQKFELCYEKRNFLPLLPEFSILSALIQFVSPFELLELAHWMFSKLEAGVSGSPSEFTSAAFVCLYIADAAMEMLHGYLKQPELTSKPYHFWDVKIDNFDATIFQRVHCKILHFAKCLKLEFADKFLLKTVDRFYSQRYVGSSSAVLSFCMSLSTMTINSPMNLLLHCFFPTSKIKARILQLLIEISPIHMDLFGRLFLGILSNDSSILSLLKGYVFSADDFLLLLPAALSYFSSNSHIDKQDLECSAFIPNFYSRTLLNGFSSWKNCVSRSIFEEEYGESVPASFEDFQKFCNSTLLGQAIIMLHHFFILNGKSLSKRHRLEIFDSICPPSDELLDFGRKQVSSSPFNKTLKLINEVFAKISLLRLLLSPPEMEGGSIEMTKEIKTKRFNHAKERFINILVKSLDQIVTNFPRKANNTDSCTANTCKVVGFLEYFILRNIIQLSVEIQSYLTQLKSIPFLYPFIRSSLLHRFEDPVTIRAIRCILVALSAGRFSAAEILELLLGHSQFVPILISNGSVSFSSTLASTGTLLQPVPSILKTIDASVTEVSSKESYNNYCVSDRRKIEHIRLLRVLYHLKNRQQSGGNSNLNVMDSKELISLLLSVYGATLGEIDLEILHLMNEIESYEGSEYEKIAEMDYLWGSAAFKVRKELIFDSSVSNSQNAANETTEERRKVFFRENMPVDSKVCAMTALQFCYDRCSMIAPLSLDKLLDDKFTEISKMQSQNIGTIQQYDPVFILRFSIHSLLMDYIEPVEFARIGLLAVTLISISSPNEEQRKLGYVSLGRFKQALESSRKSKETLQLQLLLTYLQNGISESWQKMPSIIAIFTAEASFTLLDTTQKQFFTISKFLMHCPGVNLKSVPLFKTLFGNNSIHFKADHLWILQLLYAGLNLYDDAKIYVKNNILEFLLSFYASSLSDPESRILILQIIKKSIKLPSLTHHLLKECGLLPWLSSVISSYGENIDEDKHSSLRILELVLKIINEAISSRPIMEWLQEFGLEQLSDITSNVYLLFVRALKLLKENVLLLNSMLCVIVSTLRLSQKRKIYQPHFTLSLNSLVQLCQAVNAELSSRNFNVVIELGVDAILMSTPVPVISHMDKEKLVKAITWAISVSLQLSSSQRSLTNELDRNVLISSKEQQECRISKILRWLTASLILGSMSTVSLQTSTNYVLCRPNPENLQSLLECLIGERDEIAEECSANETLAVIIMYLQQLPRGHNDALNRSVVLALCILLLNTSNPTVKKYLSERCGQVVSLCMKIGCPAETNPAWRWSYYQPWRDLTTYETEMEKMEEDQACRSLLIIFSNALSGAEQFGFPVLSCDDLEHYNLFEWETEMLLRRLPPEDSLAPN
ncbi:Nucleolar pre-ribosomal-associated protein 1 [Ananas comosus]|uniref:Nucleolar pre-ribosomal-associated protein 1 n=1 Tax=Ananas comosus TaxID=4615 RepID=A0A199VD82_ANACO|nr:Nucleolar pre-ribosomal-associated protein 1 [Ananas comosus]